MSYSTTAITKRTAELQYAISEQRKWIEMCGGSLTGYLLRYGSAADPEHHGDGGEAIHAADYAHLRRLETELAHFTGKDVK